MMEQCWEKFQKYRAQGCGTTFNLKDHLWTLFLYEKGLFDPKAYPEDEYVYEGCNCGNCHLTILSDGAVYACRRMESKVGNALTDDLYDLFTGPKFDQYRVYEKFEKCSNVTPVDTFSSYKGHMTIYAASFAALTEPWLFPMP